MAKDMYLNTEIQELKCENCGKIYKGYISNSIKGCKMYCSLECECHHSKQKKYSYELSKLILEYSFNNPYSSTRDIANIFGVSKDIVTNLIKRYGNRKPKKLEKFNRDFFNKIDTEEKAYWLGFLYADGSVSLKNKGGALELGLAKIDENHLYKFCDSVGKERKVSNKIVKLEDKEFEAVRLHLCSYEMATDLINLGCTQNKSLTLNFPTEDKVPNYLIRHFIRGYIEGDGCIGLYYGRIHFSVIGTKNFLNGMIKTFNENLKDIGVLNLHKQDKRFKNDVTTSISKSGEYALKILNYLYEDCTIYLDRKYEKYLEIVDSK